MYLGAQGYFVGRPFNFANAVGGRQQVRHAIRLISDEVRRDIGLIGVTRTSEVHPQHLLLRNDT